MALPTFVAAGTISNQDGTGDPTPGIPAGMQAGDVMLLFFISGNGPLNSNPAGWADVSGSPVDIGGTLEGLSVLYRRWQPGDAAPTCPTPAGGSKAVILGFRGVIASGNPWDVTSGGFEEVSDTSAVIPGATTTVSDCLVVLVCAVPSSSTVSFTVVNADLANLTERVDDWNTTGDKAFVMATGEKAAAGAYGTTAVTLSTAITNKLYMSVALKPEPEPITGSGAVSAIATVSATGATARDGGGAVSAVATAAATGMALAAAAGFFIPRFFIPRFFAPRYFAPGEPVGPSGAGAIEAVAQVAAAGVSARAGFGAETTIVLVSASGVAELTMPPVANVVGSGFGFINAGSDPASLWRRRKAAIEARMRQRTQVRNFRQRGR